MREPEAATKWPDLAPQRAAALPSGDLLAGPALNEKFSKQSWHTVAYLHAQGDVLVLELVGQ